MAVITAGLRNLERQLDTAFPGRRRPDGWIGDEAHRKRTSSHNPDDTTGSKPAWDGDGDKVPEVRALDVWEDLGDGADGQDLVDHLVRLAKLATVIRYLIHRGRIYHERNGFEPAAFDGDPHNDHVHIEGAWTQAADNNTSFDYQLEGVPVALTADDKKWLTGEIDKAATMAAARVWATRFQRPGEPAGNTTSAAAYQSYNDVVSRDTAEAAADRVIATLGPKIEALTPEA